MNCNYPSNIYWKNLLVTKIYLFWVHMHETIEWVKQSGLFRLSSRDEILVDIECFTCMFLWKKMCLSQRFHQNFEGVSGCRWHESVKQSGLFRLSCSWYWVLYTLFGEKNMLPLVKKIYLKILRAFLGAAGMKVLNNLAFLGLAVVDIECFTRM